MIRHLNLRKIIAVSVGVIAFNYFSASLDAATPVYSERPVRLVVGFPPGGGTDTVARIVSPRFHDALGSPWVVDNRGGAGGSIATEIVAKATPDGHTVLFAIDTSLTVVPLLYKLPIDVERDLQPVILLTTQQYALVVHPSVKASTLKEFVDLVRARPGKINYGSAGISTSQHLAMEMFKMRAGLDLVHVPYKGGGPAAVGLLGNEVQTSFGGLMSAFPFVRTGRLRALAVTGLKRAAIAPELPTVAESGFPGFELTSWYGLLVPAQTPGHVVTTLYETGRKVLQLPDVRKAIEKRGLEITIKDPQQFAKHIKAGTKLMAKVIKAANIPVE